MTEEKTPVVFLQGNKVCLRPIEISDLGNLHRWINDPEIRQFLKNYTPLNLQAEREYIEALTSRKNDISFAIVKREGNEHIGSIALHQINWKDRLANTGTMIGEKQYWGQGYGTEAKLLLLRYAFDTLNLHRVCSKVYDFNSRSLAYAKKCGYVQEGVMRKHIFRDGNYHDVVFFGVFREEFEAAWAAHEISKAKK
jgi:RimJ/RimL family protein N-acetyltransferase